MAAEEYVEQIMRVIDTCDFFENGVHFPSTIEILPNGIGIIWVDQFEMVEGNILEVRDRCFFDEGGEISHRNFRYSFRRKDGTLIFRFDSHGRQMAADEPGHVHDGAEEIQSTVSTCGEINFSYLVRCIKNFYTFQNQDWQLDE